MDREFKPKTSKSGGSVGQLSVGWANLGVRTMVGRRILTSGHGDDKGRFVISPDEHFDRSGSIRMRACVFVAVLGVDAVEGIGRRADDHPQPVPR